MGSLLCVIVLLYIHLLTIIFTQTFIKVLHAWLVFISRPTYATPKVLEQAGLTMSDISVFEYHEAFAVSFSN